MRECQPHGECSVCVEAPTTHGDGPATCGFVMLHCNVEQGESNVELLCKAAEPVLLLPHGTAMAHGCTYVHGYITEARLRSRGYGGILGLHLIGNAWAWSS